MILNKEEKNSIRIAEVLDEGDFAILRYLSDLESELEQVKRHFSNVEQKTEEAKEIAKTAFSVAKEVSKQEGRPGQEGKPGSPGKDYVLTFADKMEIARKINIPVVEKVIERIHEQPIVKETIKETITKVQDESPEQLVKKLESLTDDDRLDASAIKNLPHSKSSTNSQPMSHPVAIGNLPDVSVAGATSGQVLQYNGSYWTAVTPSASGGANLASEALTPTTSGADITLNLSALAHTVSTVLVVYRNGQALSPTRWSIGGSTLTVTSAITSDIFLILYTYA